MNAQAKTIGSHSTAAKVFGLVAVLATMFGAAGCDKLKARDLLNKGVAAFKNGQYDASIEDFKQAKDLDPTLLNARLYLATAYATEYIPGAPSDDNVRVGQQAVSRVSGRPHGRSEQSLGARWHRLDRCTTWPARPLTPDKFEESKTISPEAYPAEAR